MFPPVVRFDTGSHLGRRGLAGWNWFHSNLFLSRHHRVEGGLWGWNGILIADWPGGGRSRPLMLGTFPLPRGRTGLGVLWCCFAPSPFFKGRAGVGFGFSRILILGSGFCLIRFRLGPALRPGSGTVVSVPPFVGLSDLPSRRLSGSALPTLAILPTCGGRRRAKGEKASPLAIPGPGFRRLPGRPRAAGCSPPAGSHTPSLA
jgi:hypothetical protein